MDICRIYGAHIMGENRMTDIEIVTVNTYDGTMESLELMVKLLNLKPEDYHFNIITKCFFDHKHGLMLQPGDCYHSKIHPQKFNAIG